jgi:hypothetical protein
MRSVLKWDADTLTIDSKGKFGDAEVTIQDKWSLSEDGKTLTIQRHVASPMGEGDLKLIMEKE